MNTYGRSLMVADFFYYIELIMQMQAHASLLVMFKVIYSFLNLALFFVEAASKAHYFVILLWIQLI